MYCRKGKSHKQHICALGVGEPLSQEPQLLEIQGRISTKEETVTGIRVNIYTPHLYCPADLPKFTEKGHCLSARKVTVGINTWLRNKLETPHDFTCIPKFPLLLEFPEKNKSKQY